MPRQIKGSIGIAAIQPGYSLIEKNDGTIEGSVTWICDEQNANQFMPIGSTHPKDSRCESYTREISWLENGRASVTCAYFGLQSRKTDPIINYTPNTNQEPITAHPDFPALAGSADEPNAANGATWDQETGEFIGFLDPSVTDLFGAEFYLSPASLLTLSYWTDTIPTLKKRMTIEPEIKGFKKPADVKEFMLLDTPYRQVGSFYQVTEQWMGSGPAGFSRKIYPQ